MSGHNLPGYAELHCVTNFSFLRGASHGEELVERAAALGYAALAITDECSLAGVVRAHVEAKEHGLHLIIGSEINLLTAGGDLYAKLVLLATDRAAYGNLSEFITLARTRADKGSYRAYASDLEGKAAAHPHLQNLPGCLALLIASERCFVRAAVRPGDVAEDLVSRTFAGSRWKTFCAPPMVR